MNQIQKASAAIGSVRVRPMSTQVAEVRQHINLIQEAMKATMKKDVHFGTIPGCPKPSLYKPGAEVIMALFKLSSDPVITDLSKDGEIRYQVKVNITTRDGSFVGAGIGECSSGEDKYMWRSALCQEEYDATVETSRRIKFKKQYNGTIAQIQQVRVSPADMANTILKMAKKRALIDAILTATGASDIFSQDIEDLPDGYIPPEAQKQADIAPEVPQNAEIVNNASPEPVKPPAPPQPSSGDIITEPQRKRLYAIAMNAGMSKDRFKQWLKDNFGYESSTNIRKSDYEMICEQAEGYNPVEGS